MTLNNEMFYSKMSRHCTKWDH